MSFIISDILPPSSLEPTAVTRLNIRLTASADISREGLRELLEIMTRNEGNVPVSLFIDGIDDEELKLKSINNLQYSQNLYNELSSLDVVEKVWVS